MQIHCEKKFNFLLILLSILESCVVSINAQVSVKLPATTIIGTNTSVDYSTNNPSTTVNTKSNAFDGDLNTYFASYERSGTWLGLDLGEKHIITKVAYAPRYHDYPDGPKRLVLGIFEGANNPDFGDAVPLLMITETPQANVLTEQSINCSKGFRYVRYVGPNDVRCNIAEIEFYGYKGAGDNSYFPQLTNLPTISIHTVNAQDITSKEQYVKGIVSIIYNNGRTIFSDNLDIRGRGHASWTFPKKPYRMKLYNKVNLLGFPAREKSWTLINNWGDKTLMRNLLAFDLSKRLDMAYTSVGIPVDVILNGEYKGTYNLCDHIEVTNKRVEVQQMTVNDIALPRLSGGYLLEVDAYAGQDEDTWFSSARKNTPVKVKYPKSDEIVTQQYNYIRDHYNKMENTLLSANYKDPVNGYRKYMDMESFIRHFLVGEITGNTDTYWSVYMYKERNDDIFRFGPVWDFDLGFENDNRTYPINTHSRWVYEYGSSANGFRDLVTRLFSDESFVSRLKAIYADYRDRGILSKEALLQVVDNYASEINQSQRLNFMRWNILNTLVHQNPRTYGSYEGEVDNVRKYISNRMDWMDKKLAYSPKTGMSEISNLSNIAIYAQADAICFANVSEPLDIIIVDIAGRVIFSKSVKENTSVSVPKGMYIITVSDTKNKRTIARWIQQ
jgi:hypothetical protein